jgi:hypothetical protein
MRTRAERKVRALVRQALPFLVPAHRRYVEWSYATRTRSRERLFTRIYRANHWGDPASVSGGGSNLEQTAVLRAALPQVLGALGVRSLLDAPCGDYHWMRHVDLELERYVGGDIVTELVQRLEATHGRPGREFVRIDLTEDRLPRVDAILSGDRNRDIVTGDWRALNQCARPLDWPEPVTLINEGCTQSGSMFADKSLGVWELASLPSGWSA